MHLHTLFMFSYTSYVCKASPEERKEAQEALTKYDVLTDDEQRARFQKKIMWSKNVKIDLAPKIQ